MTAAVPYVVIAILMMVVAALLARERQSGKAGAAPGRTPGSAGYQKRSAGGDRN